MCSYIDLPAQVGRGAEATRLGQLVHEHSLQPGAHCTPAAEEGNDVLSHIKGKYGELAFYDWLKAQGFEPTHTPFRDDYSKKDPNDDFIVNGIRIEIKTKMRKENSEFPPPKHYNVNIGKKEIEDSWHIFIELDCKDTLDGDPSAIIVGWAAPSLIVKIGKEVAPGDISENKIFIFKRHDWDIKIDDLDLDDEEQLAKIILKSAI